MITKDKLLGGLYGLLIGDALGVPYEFRAARLIPPKDQIDMTPPNGYPRAWDHIPVGTYSDDGAQALCVLDALCHQPPGLLSTGELQPRLIRWMTDGYMSVNSYTFDVGNQTGAALRRRAAGLDIDGLNTSQFCGNGSLMRSLPLALWSANAAQLSPTLADDCVSLSSITHPYIRNVMCVQLYVWIATRLLMGDSLQPTVDASPTYLQTLYSDTPHMLEATIVTDGRYSTLTGSGYVVDSLWSAITAVTQSTSYEDAVKTAIQYGNDTDTTACIAGGLAGIYYGYENIPTRWMEQLQGKDQWIPLLIPNLLAHHQLN